MDYRSIFRGLVGWCVFRLGGFLDWSFRWVLFSKGLLLPCDLVWSVLGCSAYCVLVYVYDAYSVVSEAYSVEDVGVPVWLD